MKAALYTRVSTQEQAIEGYSLDAQLLKLNNYAEFQKYDITCVYTDEGFSASSINRPAMQKLIDDIKQNKVDIVIIYKLDRLSRRVKDVLELVELFEKYHVTLYSLTENLDLSSPFGRAALKMSATFSELERETIIERTKLGRDERARQGRYSCNATYPPFGYKLNKDTDRLEIVSEEADIVVKIFDLYLNGLSFRKCYEYAKSNFNHPYFSNPMSCKPIIKRPLYGGYIRYKGELYKGTNFDSILPFKTWLKAQKKVQSNTTLRARSSSPYLLTGLLLCGQCGNRYVGKLYDRYSLKDDGSPTKRYKYTAYGCAARVKRDKNYTPAQCANTIFPSAVLEQMVEQSVMNLTFTEFVDGERPMGLIDTLMQDNAASKLQIDKLLDLYMESIIDKETYQQRIAKFEKQIDKNNRLIDSEKSQIDSLPKISINFLQERQAGYITASRNEKRAILNLLIKHIAINGENITIQWRVK